MEIITSRFGSSGALHKQTKFIFKIKNKFTVRHIYSKTMNVFWYTIYDLKNLSYKKYRIDNNNFINEGKYSNGKWVVAGREELYKNIGSVEYQGYNGVKYVYQAGNLTTVNFEKVFIKLPKLSDYIDKDLMKYLPFTSTKHMGVDSNSFPLLAQINHIQPFTYTDFEMQIFED
jgi:hypothetical protein